MPKGVYDHMAARWKRRAAQVGIPHYPRDGKVWNRKEPIPGTRPVADPTARCVICCALGADWYGGSGEAVHLTCFRKSLGSVSAKQYNENALDQT